MFDPVGASNLVNMSKSGKCSPGVSLGTEIVNVPIERKQHFRLNKFCEI